MPGFEREGDTETFVSTPTPSPSWQREHAQPLVCRRAQRLRPAASSQTSATNYAQNDGKQYRRSQPAENSDRDRSRGSDGRGEPPCETGGQDQRSCSEDGTYVVIFGLSFRLFLFDEGKGWGRMAGKARNTPPTLAPKT